MATSTTTTLTNRVVTTDPQGSLIGYKGQIVEWSDNSIIKEYECISGTDWRLIAEDQLPLIQREVASLTKLKELRDFQINEKVYIKDRGANFKVSHNTYRKTFIAEYTLGIRRDLLASALSQDFFIGDKIIFKAKIDDTNLRTKVNWDYQTPATFTAPLAGEIVHSDDDIGTLHISKTADNSLDVTDILDAISVSPNQENRVYSLNEKWIITAIVDNTTYYSFTISNDVQELLDGVQEFTIFYYSNTFQGVRIGSENAGFKLELNDYKIGTFNIDNLKLNSIKDSNGNNYIVDQNLVKYNEWYIAEFEFIADYSATLTEIRTSAILGSIINYEYVEINGEMIDFKTVSGQTVTGSNGTVYTWEDELVLVTDDLTIINSDDGNDLDIISINTGTYFSQLNVEIPNGIVTPQMFGAIPVGNINSPNPFDCYDAIQKCIDLPNEIYFPVGFYYISKTLTIIIPKTIKGASGNFNDNDFGSTVSYSTIFSYNDVVADSNDTPIDYIHLLSSGIDIFGIGFNVSLATFDPTVTDYKRPVVLEYYPLKNTIIGGNLDVHIDGDRDVVSQYAKGYDGVRIDATTLRDEVFLTANGEIHKIRGAIHANALHTVLNFDDEFPYNTQGISSNTNEWYIRSQKCKITVNLKGIIGRGGEYNINHQCSDVLSYQEALYPIANIGSSGSNFRLKCHDLGQQIFGSDTIANIFLKTPTSLGFWLNTDAGVDQEGTPLAIGDGLRYVNSLWIAQSGIHVNSQVATIGAPGTRFDNPTFFNDYYGKFHVIENWSIANSPFYNRDSQEFIKLNSHLDRDKSFVADLDNALFVANKLYNVSVNTYDNDGTFDFEGDLDIVDPLSLPSGLSDGAALTSLSSNFITRLFTYNRNLESKITYLTGFDEDNDFVEIAIQGINGGGNGNELKRLIFEFRSIGFVKKIQIIRHTEGSTKQYSTVKDLSTLETVDIGGSANDNYIVDKIFNSTELIDTIILRLIGNNGLGVNGAVSINQIYGKFDLQYNSNKPFLTIAGGQKIFDFLEVPELRNPFDLPDINTSNNITSNREFINFTLSNLWRLYGRGLPPSENFIVGDVLSLYGELDIITLSNNSATLESIIGYNSNFALKITSLSTQNDYAHLTITNTLGKLVTVTFDAKMGAQGTTQSFKVDGVAGTTFNIDAVDWQKYKTTFIGTGGTENFRWYANGFSGGAIGDELLVDNLSIIESDIEVITGTVIELNYITGAGLNLDGVLVNTDIYTASELIESGKRKCWINTIPNAPSITGATQRTSKGDAWVTATDMYMFVEYDGVTIEYWFELKV